MMWDKIVYINRPSLSGDSSVGTRDLYHNKVRQALSFYDASTLCYQLASQELFDFHHDKVTLHITFFVDYDTLRWKLLSTT